MGKFESLEMEKTSVAPEIKFCVDGNLKITGRFIPDNAATLFEPLFEWIEKLDAQKVVFDINLDYLNTSSSMQLFSLLRKLEQNCIIEELIVNWHYEADDEDHYETGQFFEEKLYRTSFNFLLVA